jgi:hypothetical protein
MKNKLMMTAVVAVLAGVCASVQANPIGTQDINNFANSSTLQVASSVTGTLGDYTYTYVVSWLSGANTGINGFTVDIPNTASVDITALSQPAGFTGVVLANEVNWTATSDNALPLTFDFNSPDAWTLGNSGALDSGGYSPFAGSGSVYIPTAPDGGLTVALLGGTLVGLGALRRKLGC